MNKVRPSTQFKREGAQVGQSPTWDGSGFPPGNPVPAAHTHDEADVNGLIADLAAAASASTGELLMQDGVTAPPVPLETEARDDWLYEG